MAVLGAHAVTLEVPDLDEGIQFYTDAGLEAASDGQTARLRCAGQDRDCIVLIGGATRKRLHHITLRASKLNEIAASVPTAGGQVVSAPGGFEDKGLWVSDPNGMLIHLIEHPADPELEAAPPFEINAPGRVTRVRRSAILPQSQYGSVKLRRLGHILCFSPDVLASVKFVTEGLGMGLADRAQDVIAFTCARKDSDHHVIAFAKSPGIGFHHASFQVGDPDEVGRAGTRSSRRPGAATGVWAATPSAPTSSTTSRTRGAHGSSTTRTWTTSTTTRCGSRPTTQWKTAWRAGRRRRPAISFTTTKSTSRRSSKGERLKHS